MIIKERIVKVSDTDCTKALYFTSILRFTQEAFEEYLTDFEPMICKQFADEKIALPIIHTEASFLYPIYVGNIVKIHLDIEYKKTSFIVKGSINHEGFEKGKVIIVHVCKDLKNNQSIFCKDLFKNYNYFSF